MNHTIKRRMAITAAGLTVLAGGGIAFAATQSSPTQERKALLDNAAKRLNVSPEDLSAALQGAFEDRLDQAVKDGRLTQAQADRIKARVKADGGIPLGGPLDRGERHRHGGPGGPGRGMFFHRGPGGDAAAKYLGLTEQELHQQLESGKSLADIAKAKGKDVDGLKAAIVDEAKSHLDKAVADKMLTDAQRDKMLQELQSHVDDIVNGKPPKGARRFRHGMGFGPPGPPPGAPAPPATEPGAAPAPPVTDQQTN